MPHLLTVQLSATVIYHFGNTPAPSPHVLDRASWTTLQLQTNFSCHAGPGPGWEVALNVLSRMSISVLPWLSQSPCTMGSLLPQDPAQPLHPISTTTVIYPNAASQVSRLKLTLYLSSTSKPNESRRNHDILDTSSFQLEQYHSGDFVHSRQQSGDKHSSFSGILQHKALPQTSRWYLENSTQTCLLFLCSPWWVPARHYQNACLGSAAREPHTEAKQAVKLLHSLLKSSLITTVNTYRY